jgi:hypothetical protein
MPPTKAEVEAHYKEQSRSATNPLQVACAIRATTEHFIPAYDRHTGSLKLAVELGQGNCISRWKLAASLAVKHSGFVVFGMFHLWDSIEWTSASDSHAQLLLYAEDYADFILVEPAPNREGGDARFLARSQNSHEAAHRSVLLSQLATGRATGSAIWRSSVRTTDYAMSSVRAVPDTEPAGYFPHGAIEPSLVLPYIAAQNALQSEDRMRGLLAPNAQF